MTMTIIMSVPLQTFLKLEGLVVKEMRSPHAYSSRLHPKYHLLLILHGTNHATYHYQIARHSNNIAL